MDFNNISQLEEIDYTNWKLIQEEARLKVYQKNAIEKRVQFFDNYNLEEHFLNDKLHGLTIGRMKDAFFHFPDRQSRIYLIENYKENRLSGVQLSFYEDGSKQETFWKDDQLHGRSTTWYGNGQKEKVQNFLHGKLDGKQFSWYPNGQVKSTASFVNGIQEGERFKYLENGVLKRKQFYKKGKIEGIVYELWGNKANPPEGIIFSETEYKNNLPNGKEIVFYADKSKMREGFYKQGKEQGERIWWHKNGNVSIKEYFTNGELHGERLLFDESGNLESTQQYEHGNRIA